MNRMHIFLSTVILLLSQETFCVLYSLKAIKAYEDLGPSEVLRGLAKKPHPQIRKIIENIKKQDQEHCRAKFFITNKPTCLK